MIRVILSLGVCFCLFVTVQARKITYDDLYSIPHYSDLQISPDEKQVVFVLRTSDPKANTEQSHLWLMNSDGSGIRQITTGATGESHPRWLPHGKGILFLTDRGEGTQVWRLPLDGGEAERVTKVPTSVSEFEIMPSSKELMVVTKVFPDCQSDSCNRARTEEEKNSAGKPKLYDKLLFRHYNHWDDGRVKRLFVVSLVDSSRKPVLASRFDVPTDLLGGNGDYASSPDGKEICFAMSTDSMPAVRVNNDLYQVKLPSMDQAHFTDAPGIETTPRYSPDGRYLSYLAQARPGYESDQNDLIIYDRSKKTQVNLTEKFDRSVGGYIWDRQSSYIYLSALEHGFEKIWRIAVTTGKVEMLLGDASYGDFDFSPDGKFLVVSRSLSNQPYELYRYDVTSRKLTQLTQFTEKVTSGVEMNRAEEFWFVGALGDSIQGFLTKPPDFDATKKYPLAFLIHGGPQFCWISDFNYYGWNTQLVAAQGYVVAQVNPHGSEGYGVKFQDYVSGHWGVGDYEDLMKGVDYLLQKYPFIDSTRMAAMGRSYGGFMTNWICGHTNRFRCLITIDGTFNHISGYGSTEELWFPEWEYKGTPWTNRDEYVRSSPSTYVSNFNTPTMVIHSQKDYRVDLSEGLQMFTSLQRMGVPSELLYFPDESHAVGKLENLRVVYQRQFEWLARWLR